MKYIKLFQTIADKQAATLDYPNTNYVVENHKASIERGEPIETRLIAVYNVTKTTEPTKIMSATTSFASLEVDGVEVSTVTTGYTFSTTGEHTIKYTLTDPTRIFISTFNDIPALKTVVIPNSVTNIGDGAFQDCTGLTEVAIPNSVTSIGAWAFAWCESLTSVTRPDSVTSIGQNAFGACTGLTSVTVKATTPPSLGVSAFTQTNNCPIYVPAASVDAYKAETYSNGWREYASRIRAIQ